ncbi:hypothetical protein JOD03_001860 [Chryseomicrobium aureum]|uniref:hypothetical protein n=1 Tax=Chryseomicrobium aureum TaxID=1441723 RepID=UPI00195E1B79|nr:hypothetical protein [Chryseomicrobium aureum]MBM7706932.1 hypothetical protein [Chryseomicrobium aureum]
MKRRLVFTAILAFALFFSVSTEITVLAAPDFASPLGAGRAPTIPILPPID